MKPQLICRSLILGAIWSAIGLSSAEEPRPTTVIDDAPPQLKGLLPQLMSTTFSPDGNLLVTTAGWPYTDAQEPGELIIWDLQTQSQKVVIRQEKTIRSAAFSPDGKLLAMSDFGGRTLILDPTNGQTLATLPPHNEIVNMVLFSADGKELYACSFDGQVTVWDVAAQKVAATKRNATRTTNRRGHKLLN